MKKILLFLLFVATIAITAWLTPQAFRVHYHANMTVIIDGKVWDFSGEKYMEEVERCNVTKDVRPEDRIHLHDGKGEVVHVHMAASTWGDLFANLYWNLGTDRFADDTGGEYRTGSGKSVYYILNGEQILMNPANMIVQSEDRLLAYYGTGTFEEVLLEHYSKVSNSAIEYNGKQDPASCSQNASDSLIEGTKEKIEGVVENIKEQLPHSHSAETKH